MTQQYNSYHSILKYVSFLFYLLISFYYISGVTNIGSDQAISSLSKKPNIIQWNSFKTIDKKIELDKHINKDSFHNFDSSEQKILIDFQNVPAISLKSKDYIIPLMFNGRFSSIPYFMIRLLTYFLTPSLAFTTFIWLCLALSTLLIVNFFDKNSKTPFVVFSIFALATTPYFIFNSYFPDMIFGQLFVWIIFSLFCSELKNIKYFCIGLLIGITLLIKMSSMLCLLIFFIYFHEEIKNNYLKIIIGALPPLTLLFFLFYKQNTFGYIFEQHSSFHDFWNIDKFKIFINFLLHYLVYPGDVFNVIMQLKVSLDYIWSAKVIFSNIFQAIISISLLIFSINVIKKKYFYFLTLFILLYTTSILIIRVGVDEDLLSYFAQGFAITFVFWLYSIKDEINLGLITKDRQLSLSFFLILLLVLIRFIFWSQHYQLYKKSFNGCTWAYECMVNDWEKNKTLKNFPLLTLNYLDVGQIEFFSKEKIIPIHLVWKYRSLPDASLFNKFMINLPYDQFYVLVSYETGIPSPLSKFFLGEALLTNYFNKEVVKDYRFKGISRDFQLIKVTRKYLGQFGLKTVTYF